MRPNVNQDRWASRRPSDPVRTGGLIGSGSSGLFASDMQHYQTSERCPTCGLRFLVTASTRRLEADANAMARRLMLAHWATAHDPIGAPIARPRFARV